MVQHLEDGPDRPFSGSTCNGFKVYGVPYIYPGSQRLSLKWLIWFCSVKPLVKQLGGSGFRLSKQWWATTSRVYIYKPATLGESAIYHENDLYLVPIELEKAGVPKTVPFLGERFLFGSCKRM